LGNATLAVDDGSLVVSNIGAGGGDGVVVGLPFGTTSWVALFNPLQPQSYAPGSFFQVTSTGTINEIPNQTIATGRATNNGSEWGITFNFLISISPSDPPTLVANTSWPVCSSGPK